MLDQVTNKTGQSISFTFKSSCLISPDITVSFDNKPYEPCRSFAAGEIDRAIQRLKPNDIVLVSTWLNKQLADIDGRGRPNDFPVYVNGKRLTPAQVRSAYIASSRRIAKQLAAKGIQLVLVLDIPTLAREPVVCEAWGKLLANREGAHFAHPRLQSQPRCKPPCATPWPRWQRVYQMCISLIPPINFYLQAACNIDAQMAPCNMPIAITLAIPAVRV